MAVAETVRSERLRRGIKRRVPEGLLYGVLRRSSAWYRYLAEQRPLADQLVEAHGDHVSSGPFSGVRLVPDVFDGCLLPKLIGSYEAELHSTIEDFVRLDFKRVVDVGCASGWYVVGMAHRLPSAELYAFDVDHTALRRCRRNVALNGFDDRVRFGGFCSPEELEQLAGAGTLVIMDIEGGEVELLDPALCPSLVSTHVLVELHDVLRPGCAETISDRFSSTHEVELITSEERSPDDYPAVEVLDPGDRAQAVDEVRGGEMQWAVLSPR